MIPLARGGIKPLSPPLDTNPGADADGQLGELQQDALEGAEAMIQHAESEEDHTGVGLRMFSPRSWGNLTRS